MRSVRFTRFLFRWHVAIPCVVLGCLTLAFYLLMLQGDLHYPAWFTAGLFTFNVLLLLGTTLLLKTRTVAPRTLLRVNSLVLAILLLVNPALAIGFSQNLMCLLWTLSVAAFMLYCSIYAEETRRCWAASGVPLYTSALHAAVAALRGTANLPWAWELLFGACMSVFFASFYWFLRALSSAKEVPTLDGAGRDGVDRLLEAHGLTPREREVCCAMLDGLTARQIGERLFISEGTVKNHLKSSYRKLGVRSKMQLIHTVAGGAEEKMSLS